jgi:NADH-quinone oxidoreductase subunit H
VSLAVGIVRLLVLSLKVVLVILFFMLVRWSWPRFRFDQLMSLAWKVMLPLGIVNLVAIAIFYELGHYRPGGLGPAWDWVVALGGWGVLVVSVLAVAALAPAVTDNRPQSRLNPFGIDSPT